MPMPKTPAPAASAPEAPPSAGRSFLIFVGCLVLLVGAGIGLGSVFFGPKAKKQYDRSSPEAVIVAARDMVEAGEAERLSELLYADSVHMEPVYAELGVLLGRLQGLAEAVNDRFPDEVRAMRERAEAEARAGRGATFLQQLGAGMAGRGGPPGRGDDDRWNALLQTIAVDPYAWLSQAETRLSFSWIDDDRVAVLWDEKPIFPPFGLVMQQDRGQWVFVLPLRSVPMASRFMPQTPEEHQIWGAILQAVGNVVADLERDIRSGKLSNLDEISRATGQKAAPVIAGCMIAYSRALADRRRAEREARRAREAERENAATEASGGG